MCGITAIFDLRDRRPVDEPLLRAMTTAIRHRGPDGDGFHVEPGIGLGHRRLAIIDLAGGHQPLYNEDQTVAVVFNGEIYNFRELVPLLEARGHRFRTRCDTEVIVHAWEEWGEACVDRFNGMFAFVLWDANRQTLFAARDRFGKKPFYYARTTDGWLLVASELKSLLLAPGIDRRLDHRAVEEYFAFGYVPDPGTILAAVRKLAPAHTLTARRPESMQLHEYWDIAARAPIELDEPAIQEELIGRFRAAVERRLISDVPLGAFLSGGVDSSGVVSMMAGLSSEPVKTCSISFSHSRYDESAHADRVASLFATDHRVERVDTGDFDLLDTLAGVYDEPFADSSAIPTYRVCQLARKHVTVALSGDGGDEVFGGYRRYRWHLNEEQVRSRLPLAVRRPLFGLMAAAYPKMDWAPRVLRAKSTLQSLARDSIEGYFHSVSILPDSLRESIFSGDFLASLDGYRAPEVLKRHAERAPYRDALSLVQYLDFKTYLPGDILVKVDRAAMAHSLEVRVPILDYTFVDWVSRLRPGLKIRHGEGKYIFKKSLERVLPADILYRDKMGFAVPILEWFRGPLAGRLDALLTGPELRDSGLFDMTMISRLVNQHRRGARDHSAPLWALLMFAGFQRRMRDPGSPWPA